MGAPPPGAGCVARGRSGTLHGTGAGERQMGRAPSSAGFLLSYCARARDTRATEHYLTSKMMSVKYHREQFKIVSVNTKQSRAEEVDKGTGRGELFPSLKTSAHPLTSAIPDQL